MNIWRLLMGATVTAFALVGHAATVTIGVVDQGWYAQSGTHFPANMNYFVGWSADDAEEYRNFFIVDTSSVSGTIVGATLRAYNNAPASGFTFGYISPDASETWSLFDVDTSLSSLLAGTGGVSAFADLGTGTTYGAQNVSVADNGSYVEVTLGAAAIAALAGASGELGIGGALTTLSGTNTQAVFAGFFPGQPEVQLVLLTEEAVPSPGTIVLVGVGLAGLGLARRRKAH